MAYKLKKAFQVDKGTKLYRDLCRNSAEVQINRTMVQTGQKNLQESITERNQLIGEFLLDKNYILVVEDRFLFIEQTGEIRIMVEKNELETGTD